MSRAEKFIDNFKLTQDLTIPDPTTEFPVDIYNITDSNFTLIHKLVFFPKILYLYIIDLKSIHSKDTLVNILDTATPKGYTPLHIAIFYELVESATLLCEYNCDLFKVLNVDYRKYSYVRMSGPRYGFDHCTTLNKVPLLQILLHKFVIPEDIVPAEFRYKCGKLITLFNSDISKLYNLINYCPKITLDLFYKITLSDRYNIYSPDNYNLYILSTLLFKGICKTGFNIEN